MNPFRLDVLRADLHERLAPRHSRQPRARLARYWRHEQDWRAVEAELNR